VQCGMHRGLKNASPKTQNGTYIIILAQTDESFTFRRPAALGALILVARIVLAQTKNIAVGADMATSRT
jgi:hypothetical protein